MDRNRDLWWGLGLLNGACYLAALVGFGTYEGALAYYTRPPEAVARAYLTYGLRRLNQGQEGEARPRFDYALRY
ncbi:MAG: hypothetical protein IGQ88_07900, partial [Gloeomargaritaceae cyanobacterium C42_A2020_066]|nr:hypothetical protein [Gloeomargaritaceae cyanobacterium C42_A2020_066]